MLRARTACNFSSLIWPAGSAPTSTLHWKKRQCFAASRLSYLFAHLDLLSSETFSFLIFFLLLFSSLTPHLCFSSVHIVGSLTSKLPSKSVCVKASMYKGFSVQRLWCVKLHCVKRQCVKILLCVKASL